MFKQEKSIYKHMNTTLHTQTSHSYNHSLCNMEVWLFESVLCCLGSDDIMSADAVLSHAVSHMGTLKADPDPVDHQ